MPDARANHLTNLDRRPSEDARTVLAALVQAAEDQLELRAIKSFARDMERAFDDFDRMLDHNIGQRLMAERRVEWLEARRRAGRFWQAVEGIERLLLASGEAARQRRMEVIARRHG